MIHFVSLCFFLVVLITANPLSAQTNGLSSVINISEIEQWNGFVDGDKRQQFLTARNEKEWQKLWKTIGRGAPHALSQKNMAIGIHLGERRSSGNIVKIGQIQTTINGRFISVVFEELRFKAREDSLAVMARPWIIITIIKTERAIIFRKAETSFQIVPPGELKRLIHQALKAEEGWYQCEGDLEDFRYKTKQRIRSLNDELENLYLRCPPYSPPLIQKENPQ